MVVKDKMLNLKQKLNFSLIKKVVLILILVFAVVGLWLSREFYIEKRCEIVTENVLNGLRLNNAEIVRQDNLVYICPKQSVPSSIIFLFR